MYDEPYENTGTEFVYYSPYDIKCPFCEQSLSDSDDVDLEKLEVSAVDFTDSSFETEESIECPYCHGRMKITIESEIAEIESTYYVLGTKDPDKIPEHKDMPGQMFFWPEDPSKEPV